MKTILLIEDNLEMRENTAEILELANYRVETAEDGKLGVAKAKEVQPDLIICDIMMPELDGYGVLYLLSKDPETASIPFIFLSAKAEKSDMRMGMNLGADDYITKPFEEKELLEAIESRLKRSEVFKTEFDNDLSGINRFIDEASALQELEELSKDRKLRKYSKKDIVFYEDDYPLGIYFIKEGKLKTYKENDEGKEIVTGLYGRGDFIGYMALLQDTNYTESAAALEDAELYRIPREDFMALLLRNRDVAHRFIKLLSGNLMEKEKQLLDLAYSSVRKRVANGLLRLRDRYLEKGEEEFSIAIPRDDLAGIVGTATETVIRTLSEFKDEGLIEIKGRRVSILKPDELQSYRY